MPAEEVFAKIARALGRSATDAVPAPPEIDEPLVRLVHSEIGLPELFVRRAAENKISVTPVAVEELASAIADFCRQNQLHRVALAFTPFLQKLNLHASLREAGLDAVSFADMELDDLYSVDAGVTDVYAAIAETGSLVIRPTADHARALSLVPPVHVAVVQPKDLLPDLLDLFQKLAQAGSPPVTLISGPSKTADIEMTIVTGVHGPGVVQVFLLQ